MPPDTPQQPPFAEVPEELSAWQERLVSAITHGADDSLAPAPRLRAHSRNLTGIRRRALEQTFPLAREKQPDAFETMVGAWLRAGLSRCADLEHESDALLRAWRAGHIAAIEPWDTRNLWHALLAVEQLRQLIGIGEADKAPYKLIVAHRIAPTAAVQRLPHGLNAVLGNPAAQDGPGYLVVARPPSEQRPAVTAIDTDLYMQLIALSRSRSERQRLPTAARRQLVRLGWIQGCHDAI